MSATLTAAALAGCGSDPSTCAESCTSPKSNEVHMDFTRSGGFYAAPFPSDDRIAGGTIDLGGFPNPKQNDVVKEVVDLIVKDAHGFGTTSTITFQLDATLGAAKLPDVHASVKSDAPVFLVSIDHAAPDFGKRYPVDVAFTHDGGPFGDAELLSLLPLQGVPLRPKTRYAAVVRTSLAGDDGTKVSASPSMQDLAAGRAPAGLSGGALAGYRDALTALAKLGVEASSIAGLAVFTTDDPTAVFSTVLDAMIAAPLPEIDAPFAPDEVFPGYCVFSTTIPMPEYQGGKPPYEKGGGAWVFDAHGKPVLQRTEKANFVVTVPRQTMPAQGFPIVLFSRTGGGGERPLVDRGVQKVHDGPAIEPGTGPADYFAMAGYAGASIDGPLGGLRNTTHGDEQFLIFNVGNPPALRDNIRQSAAELALGAHVLAALHFDASSCAGFDAPGGMVAFDDKNVVIMGHSMGATISPLSIAAEPMFGAAILSGAGGSWIENVIYKESPVEVKGLAQILLGINPREYELNEHDPALNLFQWAGEPADPPVYARAITLEPSGGKPRHVLMEQGIVDTYILPPIANATSLSIGLDLGGKELDGSSPKLARFTPLGDLLGLVGRGPVSLPAELPVHLPGGAKATALVVQHPQDDVEDGHEVLFQTDPPKREYVCFLRTLLTGKPRVPNDAGPVGECD